MKDFASLNECSHSSWLLSWFCFCSGVLVVCTMRWASRIICSIVPFYQSKGLSPGGGVGAKVRAPLSSFHEMGQQRFGISTAVCACHRIHQKATATRPNRFEVMSSVFVPATKCQWMDIIEKKSFPPWFSSLFFKVLWRYFFKCYNYIADQLLSGRNLWTEMLCWTW